MNFFTILSDLRAEIICCDKHANRPADSYRLILLKSGWHIGAYGYLRKVADVEKGRQIIETSQTLTK